MDTCPKCGNGVRKGKLCPYCVWKGDIGPGKELRDIIKEEREPTKFCTRCENANLRVPIYAGAGWITCPFRKGDATRSSGAPCADAFPEFSHVCEHFKEREDAKEE